MGRRCGAHAASHRAHRVQGTCEDRSPPRKWLCADGKRVLDMGSRPRKHEQRPISELLGLHATNSTIFSGTRRDSSDKSWAGNFCRPTARNESSGAIILGLLKSRLSESAQILPFYRPVGKRALVNGKKAHLEFPGRQFWHSARRKAIPLDDRHAGMR